MSTISATMDALAVLSGFTLGICYFTLLARSVRLHVRGASAGHMVALLALRATIAVGAFWMAAQFGALVLLLTLLGFYIGRAAIQLLNGVRI